MFKSRTLMFFCFVLLGLILYGFSISEKPVQAAIGDKALIIELEGPINPGNASYVTRGLEEAKKRGAVLVVIRLDTPGGLATSMRTIIKGIMNSPVPVIVYVAPSGAGAASAGVMITVAGHIAAMAPGTNIGAAHPVTAGGKDIGGTMSEKVVNDMASYGRGIAGDKGKNGQWVERAIRESVSITADEALKINVIDLIAEDMDELFRLVDGMEVGLTGKKVVIKSAGLRTEYFQIGFRDRVLKTISDPNFVWILFMIGLAGIGFEITHPGSIFPGVIGAISLILAFYAMQTLPVNYAGLLLIVLSIIFFIAEIKVTSYGVLSIGGLISLVIGSIMLFEDVGVSLKLLIPTAALLGGFFIFVAGLALRAHRISPKSGSEGLRGEIGFAKRLIDPEGLVFVHGENWRARSPEKIEPGEEIEVEGINGLILNVRKPIKQKP